MSVDANSLLRLEKTSLREQALTALRKAITTGQLAPSTHLVETELSEALQISRGTLREAMRQLQQEGLISAGARGRLSVRHLDTKEIRDIFNVRAALESLAARELAAQPDRAEAVSALRRAVERAYGLDHLPSEDEMVQIAGRWRPYRSLAVSYLFASEFEKGT